MNTLHGTTILAVRRPGQVAVGGDGQVTLGDTVLKGNARKVRRLYHGRVLAGFAGATADAFTLFERFEGQLEKHLVIADTESVLTLSGTGDVIEPEDDLMAVGSGGPYAQAAGRALMEGTELPAQEVTRRALEIAGDICVYTNRNITVETLPELPEEA